MSAVIVFYVFLCIDVVVVDVCIAARLQARGTDRTKCRAAEKLKMELLLCSVAKKTDVDFLFFGVCCSH